MLRVNIVVAGRAKGHDELGEGRGLGVYTSRVGDESERICGGKREVL